MANDDQKSGGNDAPTKPTIENSVMGKAIAAVFVTVLAPILVAVGMKYSDNIVANINAKPAAPNDTATKTEPAVTKPASADAAKPPSAETATSTSSSTNAVAASSSAAPAPVVPKDSSSSSTGAKRKPNDTESKTKPSDTPPKREEELSKLKTNGPVIRLFNLKDLTGWYTYLDKTSESKGSPGRNHDPDGVFSVAKKTIHISGQYWGTLTTEKTFHNYHLTVEYKWGDLTYTPREIARQSGLLLHGFGDDGAVSKWAPMSIKCQIIEGGTGDLVAYSGNSTNSISFSVEAAQVARAGGAKKPQFQFRPGSPLTPFSSGMVHRLGNNSDWKNEKGFHRTGDIEKPASEWNTLECYCVADKISVLLNGTLVNEASEVKPTKGRISLQSHGAEIFLRKVELQPISPP